MMEITATIVERQIPGAKIRLDPGVDVLGYKREQLDISAAARDLDRKPEFTLERGIAAYTDFLKDEKRAVR